MASSSQRSGSAGGILLAASLLIGTIVGLVVGEPTIGFLLGLGIGSVAAVLLWLQSRG